MSGPTLACPGVGAGAYAALLRGVLDNPADVSARALILADWCDEHGREDEARLLRIERPPPGGARTRAKLPTAVKEYLRLLEGYRYPPGLSPRRVWPINSPDYPGVERAVGREIYCSWESGTYLDVRHGFVTGLACCWRQFRRHAAGWFARNPVRHVLLLDYQGPCGLSCRPEAFEDLPGDIRYRSWYPGVSLSGLPRQLWERLTGYVAEDRQSGPIRRCYGDNVAARLALSRACVSYGRELAGLPKEVGR
jgi:uncharacterized protein (TIGR02996 family)